MESSSSDYYNKDNEEESLLANVASLRHELKITEWNLQSLGEELSSVSPSENSDYAFNRSKSERLILEDLSQPSQFGLLNYLPYKKVCKMPNCGADFQKKPRDEVIIFRPVYFKYFSLNFFFFKCFVHVYHSLLLLCSRLFKLKNNGSCSILIRE